MASVVADKGPVCITGAGGFVASWLVKLLLSQDYIVHGTVRDPGDEKYIHLNKLEKASDKLRLFKADLLDYNSLVAAFTGCIGVFHVASPVPAGPVSDPETELMEPAVKGTLNVVKACLEANIKRVVVVSSTAAVFKNPSLPDDLPRDETSWSDQQHLREINLWYFVSKTEAERQALEFGEKTGLNVLSVCPSLVLGPMLQNSVNFSSLATVSLLKGLETFGCKFWSIVDVRDLAEALLLVYEKSEADGRYICSSSWITVENLVEMLRKHYPNYSYPTSFKEGTEMPELNTQKLQRLGWSFRPLEETLIDSVESYKQTKILE